MRQSHHHTLSPPNTLSHTLVRSLSTQLHTCTQRPKSAVSMPRRGGGTPAVKSASSAGMSATNASRHWQEMARWRAVMLFRPDTCSTRARHWFGRAGGER